MPCTLRYLTRPVLGTQPLMSLTSSMTTQLQMRGVSVPMTTVEMTVLSILESATICASDVSDQRIINVSSVAMVHI